jgi:hypothetical protein
MPTARELLEQADALMRRNRAADADIPVLTDVVAEGRAPAFPGAASDRAGVDRREALREAVEGDESLPTERTLTRTMELEEPADHQPPAAASEPPVLTDVIGVSVESPPPAPGPVEDDALLWLGPDTVDPELNSITGPAPDAVSVVPPVKIADPEPPAKSVHFFDEPDVAGTKTLRAAGSAPTPAPARSMPWILLDANGEEPQPSALEADDERWRVLAEQISMQVLQRIDLFTDTGLKSQLASHLEPIVARAGAELVQAINDHVGKLIRSYVAEAIEREIETWRGKQ